MQNAVKSRCIFFYAYTVKDIISLSHKKLMKSLKLQWLLKEYSNKFDIILMPSNYDTTVNYILHYRLWERETKGILNSVVLSPYWFLKWGQYHDQTVYLV